MFFVQYNKRAKRVGLVTRYYKSNNYGKSCRNAVDETV